MADRPSGTVTFSFTDVEGSTGSWAADREAMAANLLVHDDIVRHEVWFRGGYVFTTAGDSFGLDGRAQLDPAGIQHEALQGVLADLRAELARCSWATRPTPPG